MKKMRIKTKTIDRITLTQKAIMILFGETDFIFLFYK